MAIDVVGDVASGIDAFDRGSGGAWLDDQIAAFLDFQLTGEQFGRRGVADGDEDAVGGDFGGFTGDGVFQAHAGDVLGHAVGDAEDFLDGAVPDDVDLGVGEQAVLQDFFRTQGVAAVNQRDALGEIGEEEGFFDSGIAAADDHDLFAAIEEAVAGGAGRDAKALIGIFRFKAQPLGLCARRDDNGFGQQFRARIQR